MDDLEKIEKLINDIWFQPLQVKTQFDPENFWGESYGTVEIESGWKAIYFEDCGDMDYVEKLTSPSGEAWSYAELERMGVHSQLDSVLRHRILPEKYGPREPSNMTIQEVMIKSFFEITPFQSYLKQYLER